MKRGTSRWCFITNNYAVKIPALNCWRCFLKGILANLQEAEFGRCGFYFLAPVLWKSWGGIVIVMPRVDVQSDQPENVQRWYRQIRGAGDYQMYFNIVEPKPSSIGWYQGYLVAVDYAN